MICPFCGKENPENLEVCDFCGGPLTIANKEPVEDANPLEPKVTIIETPPEPEILPPAPQGYPAQPPRGASRNRIWWLVGCVALVIIFLCCGAGILSILRIASRIGDNPVATLMPSIGINLLPSQSPANDPNTLLFDDFSDPSSGWDTINDSDYYSDYYQDSYRMTIYADMSDSWSNPDSNVFGDVRVEADASKNGGPDDNDFGLICRYQNSDQFYYAIISSDGYYGILRMESASSTQLGFEELQPSDVIRQGESTNHIRFDCVGDVLTLYVNGQQIDQQTDSSYSSGNVGLIAGTYDVPGTDILFDNFTVLKP